MLFTSTRPKLHQICFPCHGTSSAPSITPPLLCHRQTNHEGCTGTLSGSSNACALLVVVAIVLQIFASQIHRRGEVGRGKGGGGGAESPSSETRWYGADCSSVGTDPTGWECHTDAQTCVVEARIKNYIIYRQQTDLYLCLPYTEDIGQINLDNVIYNVKCPKMYKTKSKHRNINMKSPIATIITSDFISDCTWTKSGGGCQVGAKDLAGWAQQNVGPSLSVTQIGHNQGGARCPTT